jgi:hypothetical protein
MPKIFLVCTERDAGKTRKSIYASELMSCVLFVFDLVKSVGWLFLNVGGDDQFRVPIRKQPSPHRFSGVWMYCILWVSRWPSSLAL